jgi:hypothetical protein
MSCNKHDRCHALYASDHGQEIVPNEHDQAQQDDRDEDRRPVDTRRTDYRTRHLSTLAILTTTLVVTRFTVVHYAPPSAEIQNWSHQRGRNPRMQLVPPAPAHFDLIY